MAKKSTSNAFSLIGSCSRTNDTITLARQDMTELETQIVLEVIGRIGLLSQQGSLRSGYNVAVTIPLSELPAVSFYEINAAAESLQRKRLLYNNAERGQLDFIVLFPQIRFSASMGLELTAFADAIPFFSQLGQRFTRPDLASMLLPAPLARMCDGCR